MTAARVVKGASSFGVTLGLGDDGELVWDADHEPSDGTLARIKDHAPAIVALLKARQTAAAIQWPLLADLDASGYEALRYAAVEDLNSLQLAIDRLEKAAAVILPTMRTRSCSWQTAVKFLLAESHNARFSRLRPKRCSDEEWLAALYAARVLGYANGPRPPRGVIE